MASTFLGLQKINRLKIGKFMSVNTKSLVRRVFTSIKKKIDAYFVELLSLINVLISSTTESYPLSSGPVMVALLS